MTVPIFVINLKRSPERRVFMENQLQALGLSFEIVEGVDWKLFTPEQQDAYEKGKADGTHKLSPGLFGSSSAHLKVYEHIQKEQIDRALVLEDDVYLGKNFAQVLQEPWVHEDWWEFVHLGYTTGSFALFKSWLRGSWYNIKKNPFFFLYALAKFPYIAFLYTFENIRARLRKSHPAPVHFFRPVYLGSAYLVTLSGVQKMLSIAYPVRYEADKIFNQARIQKGMRFFGYCPPPASTVPSFGTDTL